MILVQCNHLPHNTLPHMSGITAQGGSSEHLGESLRDTSENKFLLPARPAVTPSGRAPVLCSPTAPELSFALS